MQIGAIAGGIVFGTLVGVMAASNPGQKAYEEYATEQLTIYLKEKGCTQLTQGLEKFLQRQCGSLVDTGRPQIKQIIVQNTQRYNLILFSIYQTDLSLPSSLPDYHFQTVGVLNNFYLLEAERI